MVLENENLEESTEEAVEEEVEEAPVAPEEDNIVFAGDASEDAVADEPVDDGPVEAEEEAAEAPASFASPQDAVQASFVAGAQALADRKKAERAERLASDQGPRRKPQFAR